MSDTRPVLLILRALGLGDLLTAVPALRALAHAFPTHRRVLATTKALAPLALQADLADEVVPCTPFAPLAYDTYRPAIAVDLQGRGPQSHHLLLATRPARLIAFSHPLVPESWSGPTWRSEEHQVRRWCRLLTESGIVADPSALDIALPPRPFPAEAIGATLVHPGAATAARRWPIERWAGVVASERSAGRTVLLTGNAAERSIALQVARRAGLATSAVFAGRTDVLSLAALVRAAARVVCGDTGVAHLATALRAPSVVLFGPTPPSECGPPAHRPWHRVLWAGMCGDPHGARPDPGLLHIRLEEVLRALHDLPRATPAAGVAARPWGHGGVRGPTPLRPPASSEFLS